MVLRTLLMITTLFFLATGSPMADEQAARSLILSQGCKGCHAFEGKGGVLAPSLDLVGERLSLEQIRQKLLDPKSSAPDSVMPAYGHLTDEELRTLARFLSTRNKRK